MAVGAGEAIIRPATTADVPALLRLYAQLGDPEAVPSLDHARETFAAISVQPGMHLLVAEASGRAVGTATLVIVPNLTHFAKPWAQVENMVVEEELRGRGLGRALLDRCVELATEAGCYKVQLQSANQRLDAHQFYERLGFQASSVGFRLYLD
ncbi:MAG TPA: GNAT family N-acetyltransferase [Tepidiformaceae bacterium]|jgi:GNAT superfamily N-acetyltransferase